MAKKVVIIFGHPLEGSFNAAVRDAVKAGLQEAGAEVRELRIAEMQFNPVLEVAYTKIQQLEPDLLKAQADIKWAEHVIVIHPVWWGGMPAKLKGFFDRVFHPSWAFKFAPNAKLPQTLLDGRSARIIQTMDNYPILYKWIFGQPGIKQLSTLTLKFCGIKPVKTTLFGSVKFSTPEKRAAWLAKAKAIGAADGK
jgi:putative NADPH-quinone reductase